MGANDPHGKIGTGQWMALSAALLGWMFDGLEMGLFPLVARPALQNLLPGMGEAEIGKWISVTIATFLVGAATGGVLFGWLGDRIGRVRAMMLSVLTYAIFTGLCGIATSAEQIAILRFIAALGMGGEWSLGVALVMEIWPDKSRAFLAGLIGAAANVGFLLIALLSLGLVQFLQETEGILLAVLPASWVEPLVSHSGWRILMMMGALPALLTFFIRFFVPESERWQEEQARGTTSNWAAKDLSGVLVGAGSVLFIIYLWAAPYPFIVAVAKPLPWQLLGTLGGLIVATLGFLYPVTRYLGRVGMATGSTLPEVAPTVRRMLLGACLGGVALLGTWASIQWAPTWAHELSGEQAGAREYTQICSGLGAIVGTITAALAGGWFGRRITYFVMCLASLAAALVFFQLNSAYGTWFLVSVFVAGGVTASFYGWLPLYLPELFVTKVRATGQGFSFNFGRILAAVGALQTGTLMGLFKGETLSRFLHLLGLADSPNIVEFLQGKAGYPLACSIMSLIYLAGMVIIWFAPETKGQALPE
ncbi:MAG: MFS transporter [Gemmataceae bacterium]